MRREKLNDALRKGKNLSVRNPYSFDSKRPMADIRLPSLEAFTALAVVRTYEHFLLADLTAFL